MAELVARSADADTMAVLLRDLRVSSVLFDARPFAPLFEH